MDDFAKRLQEKTDDVEKGLKPYIPEGNGYEKLLWEVINYSLLAGGKRLRPIFMYETFCMFGGDKEESIRPFMAGLEMIHTYSLVHDDLPAMDDDDFRRGRPTSHKVYGEDMAILAGDGLLNLAFETALKSFDHTHELKRVGDSLKIMAKKAGGHGMLGGQVVDVQMSGQLMDENLVAYIYEKKTSALMEAAMMIGAVMAGSDQEQVKEIEIIARKIGLAFQIQDDILDAFGNESAIGKPTHSDEKNHKTTYASLFGEENAKKRAWNYSNEAIEGLKKMSPKSKFLQELVIHLMNRHC